MMGRQSGQKSVVILDLSELIPENHLLRKINQIISFDFIYDLVVPYDLVSQYCGDDVYIWGEPLKQYTIVDFKSLTSVSEEAARTAKYHFATEVDYTADFDNLAEVIVEAEFENTNIGITTYDFICVQRDGVWELWYVDDSIGWLFGD